MTAPVSVRISLYVQHLRYRRLSGYATRRYAEMGCFSAGLVTNRSQPAAAPCRTVGRPTPQSLRDRSSHQLRRLALPFATPSRVYSAALERDDGEWDGRSHDRLARP